jgi:predicted RNA-binding Zn ribbon-like protein
VHELELVEAFGNSIDIDSGRDEFESPERFGGWLAAHGFAPAAGELTEATRQPAGQITEATRQPAGQLTEAALQAAGRPAEALPRVDGRPAEAARRAADRPTEAEWRLALGLRAALRDELAAHRDQDQARVIEARARIDARAAQVPLRATFHAGGAGLAAVDRGAAEMLGAVLTAMVAAHRDGSWHRLKMCQASTCDVVFYDRSKNGSKAWCSMRICGNRNKTRSYRGRQRVTPTAGS